VLHHVSDNGKLFSGLDKAKKQRPKSSQGIIRCWPKNSEAMAMRSGAHGGLMYPLEKRVRRIWTGPQMPGRSWRAGKATAATESPQALIASLESGSGGLKRNARSVRGWDRVPMKKQGQGGKSSLGQHCCHIAAFYRGPM
jgi:hypothetical protein